MADEFCVDDLSSFGIDVSVRDGSLLHDRVHPSRWCINKRDLRQFRKVALAAVRKKFITPSDEDMFNPLDTRVGPSIVSVTEHLIKPITRTRGDASWALMLHPDGLPCDLFVTHCWQEGTFEFIDKVLFSWPYAARNAYCCMLSNPQNLDIGSMLSRPDCSPFAEALRTARCTLVVPNAHCSVYTRIWCVYEAYLSYSWDKPIFTARSRVEGAAFVLFRSVTISAIYAGGFLLLIHYGWIRLKPSYELLLMLLVCGAGAASLALSNSTMLTRVNDFGSAVCGILVGFKFASIFLLKWNVDDNGMFVLITPKASIVFGTLICAIFALREIDRLRENQAKEDGTKLHQNYTGKLYDSMSSVARDRDRILEEISRNQEEGEVERAISVLICAGLSTPALRQAERCGVDLYLAGNWSIAMVFCIIFAYIIHPASHIILDSSCTGAFRWVPWFKVAEGVTWTLLFKYRGVDQRGIMTSAGILLAALPYFTLWTVYVAWRLVSGSLDQHSNCLPDIVGCFGFGPLALLVSVLGVHGCARIPVVGPGLVNALLHSCQTRDKSRRPIDRTPRLSRMFTIGFSFDSYGFSSDDSEDSL
eukprot:TRINITY_DN6681_c0_g2_i1.p1 TRINITY_DN6681_c0_g2~~TRINITY_DN6681_c0_g2_i1.p1  ORF type:complete len:589 (+),score=42.39 TRINITY_DN6681_c0_g2_i1:26-1792(+)